jgi:hypothetical protein
VDFRTLGAILVTVAAKRKGLTKMPKGPIRSTLIASRVIALLALSSVLLPLGVQAAPDGRALATGAWGGEHIVLEVSERGAEAEFDCAHGQVTQPIMLDKHGDFDVAGTFTREQGGPMRRDENVTAAPARYLGHVDGHIMSLTVTLGKGKMGSFTLIRGSLPNLTKCR